MYIQNKIQCNIIKSALLYGYNILLLKNTGIFSASSVIDFAKSIGIAPGIVVGRLQKEGCIQHNMLNDLKEQYIITV